MGERVPGVTAVDAQETPKMGESYCVFRMEVFKDPFIARYVSDGTIKMFAYLGSCSTIPNAHPLLCVEEPENQLYPDLIGRPG